MIALDRVGLVAAGLTGGVVALALAAAWLRWGRGGK